MTHQRSPALTALAALIGLILCAPPVLAQNEPTVTAAAEQSSLRFGAEALTSFPIQLGGRLWLELPGRVRVGTSLGYLPGAYESAVNSVLVDAGAYDKPTGELVRAALSSSLVWRAEVGWRPFSDLGGYIDVGYALATIRGDFDLASLADVLDQPSLTAVRGLPNSYALSGLLHMITVELGWQWLVYKGLTIRAAAGAAISVAATAEIQAGGTSAQTSLAAGLISASEVLVEETLTQYVVTPTISLALGWQVYPF